MPTIPYIRVPRGVERDALPDAETLADIERAAIRSRDRRRRAYEATLPRDPQWGPIYPVSPDSPF